MPALTSPYYAILFDADRTLWDTMTSEAETIRQITAKWGIPYQEEMPSVYSHINETLWQQIETGAVSRSFVQLERWRQFLQHFHLDFSPEEWNAEYLHIFSQLSYLCPHALEVCQALVQQGKLLYLVTNGTAKVQKQRLAASPLTPCLNGVFISEEVGIPKPHSGFFHHVFQEMEPCPKEEILIVGDSLTSDIRGGNLAGIDSCWYNPLKKENPGTAVCQYEIADLRELIEG